MERSEVAEFFGHLHTEHPRPAGFKKTRHTFRRERASHSEIVQLQGSAWNARDRPWRFYVAFGLAFSDVGVERPSIPFLPGAHAACRIDALVPGAPGQFDVADDPRVCARALAELIVLAGDRIASELPRLRARWLANPRSPLTLQIE